MAVYVCGDTHNNIDISNLSFRNFPESRDLGAGDFVIICGDFGFPLFSTDTLPEAAKSPNADVRSSRKTYLHWMDWLSKKPYTILFVDGNHDNVRWWNGLPVEEWNGGRVHRSPDAPNVMHLMRGEYYTICGKTFWTFGGAGMHDRHISYEMSQWMQILPSDDECLHGIHTLGEHECKVDYIITHTMPAALLPRLGFDPSYHDAVTDYLDIIYQHTQFAHWYCGHFHQDQPNATDRLSLVYMHPIKIAG